MMELRRLRFAGAPKETLSLLLNSAVVDTALAMGMDVSATAEALLAAEVRRQYWERWKAENQQALDSYNERIAREGLPLAKYRRIKRSKHLD